MDHISSPFVVMQIEIPSVYLFYNVKIDLSEMDGGTML